LSLIKTDVRLVWQW